MYFGRNTGERRKLVFGEEAELEGVWGKLSGCEAVLAAGSATPWREFWTKTACGRTPPPTPASEGNDQGG